ncbi:MAG TPA: hypothetical protein VIN35_05685 [Hydrogenophaga sp.]
MKKIATLLACTLVGLTTLNAQAESVENKAAAGVAKGENHVAKGLNAAGFDSHDFYGELGLSILSYKISSYGISSRPIMLRAIAGYDFHPNLAVEGMLGLGLRGSHGVGYYGSTYNVSAGSMIGAYLKPRMGLGDVELFGRLGLTNTSSSVRGYTGTDGGASFSYGAGLRYQTQWAAMGNRDVSINADYMSYYSGSGLKYTGFTIGAGLKF